MSKLKNRDKQTKKPLLKNRSNGILFIEEILLQDDIKKFVYLICKSFWFLNIDTIIYILLILTYELHTKDLLLSIRLVLQ